MKILVKKASDWDYKEEREVNTLKELQAINDSIIIDFDVDVDTYGDFDAIVTIYDDYVE